MAQDDLHILRIYLDAEATLNGVAYDAVLIERARAMDIAGAAVLRIEDFIDTLADLPEVSAIGVHIEGIRDSQRFQTAALKALANNVPLVVLKTGSSTLGSELTVSHTGSLSGAALKSPITSVGASPAIAVRRASSSLADSRRATTPSWSKCVLNT